MQGIIKSERIRRTDGLCTRVYSQTGRMGQHHTSLSGKITDDYTEVPILLTSSTWVSTPLGYLKFNKYKNRTINF